MRRRILPRIPSLLPAIAVLLVLSGCASGAVERLHTLMPAEVAPRSGAARAPIEIVLEPIRVPASVDQPQWLVRLADDSVAVLEQERWASPLRDELRQALLESLIVRHGIVDARTAPGGRAPLRVGVDVRRFESVPGREARIEGSWSIVDTRGSATAAALRCDWSIREPAGSGYPALAEAHRRALARLADGIGAGLAAVADAQRYPCPSVQPRA